MSAASTGRPSKLTKRASSRTRASWSRARRSTRRSPSLASAPTLAVGLHLVVIDGKAVLPPEEIPLLVDSEGRFSNAPVSAGARYFFRPSARAQLRREIRAQLERFRSTGLPLSHVDGHHHLHVHPVVLSCLADLAAEFRIPAIRLPSEELSLALRLDPGRVATKVVWAGVFGRLRRRGERRFRNRGVAIADRVYGLLATGRIIERYLLDLIPRIRANAVEIYSHPALAFPSPGSSPASSTRCSVRPCEPRSKRPDSGK